MKISLLMNQLLYLQVIINEQGERKSAQRSSVKTDSTTHLWATVLMHKHKYCTELYQTFLTQSSLGLLGIGEAIKSVNTLL